MKLKDKVGGMIRYLLMMLTTAAVVMAGGGAQAEPGAETVRIKVMNPTKDDWTSVPVVVPARDGKGFNSSMDETGIVTYVQSDDLDEDGRYDELTFPASLKAGQSKTYLLSNTAELSLVPVKAFADMYSKSADGKGLEGPAWESDMIAFRIYWNEQNAIDVFCKTTPSLSLEKLAQADVNYHNLTPWGMDVLQVGDSLGIGGFGAMINGKVEKVSSATREFAVRALGANRAVCDLIYTDWDAAGRKLELTARMKIYAGQDWAECDLQVVAKDGGAVPELVCGFVKNTSNTQLLKDEKLGMVGSWGNQSLGEGQKPEGGSLGLAVMGLTSKVDSITEDKANHYLVLKPSRSMRYRYLVDWYKDPAPTTSSDGFYKRMRQVSTLRPIISFEP